MSSAIRVLEAQAVEIESGPDELGEGPIWLEDRGELAWVDILRGLIHLLDGATGRDRTIEVGAMVGAIAPTKSGSLVAAVPTGFALIDPATGGIRPLARLDRVDRTIRMNDGKVDPFGRFWAGTMGLDQRPNAGSLYCLDASLKVTTVLEGVTISNGLDWPNVETMYYVDTPTHRVDVFDLDRAELIVRNRRPFITVPDDMGVPDGLTVDAAARVWVALWGGSAVHCFSPAGTLEAVVRLPVSHVTSCTFGGPDLGDLYITTAFSELDPDERRQQPLAGRLFRCRPEGFGRPANRFDDTRATLLAAG